MSMRDLIPWSRQGTAAPAVYRDEERNPFLNLRHDIDRLFDDVFRGTLPSLGGRSITTWPSVEVGETDREIRVTAELPGLTDNDIEVSVEEGILKIRGEKKSESQDNDRGYSERFYGRFERRIALPVGVDSQTANATFRDGVLTIALPRTGEAARGKRIPINSETKH